MRPDTGSGWKRENKRRKRRDKLYGEKGCRTIPIGWFGIFVSRMGNSKKSIKFNFLGDDMKIRGKMRKKEIMQ